MFDLLSEFHFIRPYLLILLLGIPALWYLQRKIINAANEWTSAIDPALLKVLMPLGKTVSKQRFAFFANLVALLAILGVSGPAIQKIPQPVEQRSDALVIVLDLSTSMMAQDIRPSRMERAKQKITDIFESRNEGFTSLVVFAGDAHVVAPMTDDTDTLLNLLQSLNPAMMPVQGSQPAAGIEIANQLLDNVDVSDARILLVTDGVDRLNEVTRELDDRFPISILGVGTETATTIPMDSFGQPGKILGGPDGQPVRVSLDTARLKGLASLAAGRYRTISIDGSDLEFLLNENALTQDSVQLDREYDQWEDLGYLLVIPLLLIVLFTIRRGVLVALLILIALPNEASWFDELFTSKDSRAYRELTEGRPDAAADLFEDELWRGVAKYRIEEFDTAGELFRQEESATGAYNFGNALAKAGELEAAIAAYDNVLKLDPDHDDARFNKELLEKYLAEQQESSGEGNEIGESAEEEGSSNASESADGSESMDQRESDETSTAESSAESTEESAETMQNHTDDEEGTSVTRSESLDPEDRELQETYERWLRAIPDVPGNILKEKFAFETNERREQDGLRQKNETYW